MRRPALIDVAQRAGLSLDEIRDLLEAGSDPISDQLRHLAAKKLLDVEALIRRTEAMRDGLRTAEGCGCRTIDVCGLFDHERASPVPPLERTVVKP